MKNIRQSAFALSPVLSATLSAALSFGALCSAVTAFSVATVSLQPAPAFAQSSGSYTNASKESIRTALSAFEVSQSLTQLESIAGGKDALVAILLSLRNDEETRFVSTRSEQLLLSYADRPEVLSALKSDLDDSTAPGHAIAIVTHIDSVPSVAPRRELAKSGLARATRDASFHPYARMLTMNDDVEIKKSAQAINLQ